MEPPDPLEPDEDPTPEIPPPLRVPEEYPGATPERPDRRRPHPEVPDDPEQPWFGLPKAVDQSFGLRRSRRPEF